MVSLCVFSCAFQADFNMAAYVYTVVFGKVFFQYVVLYLFGSALKVFGAFILLYSCNRRGIAAYRNQLLLFCYKYAGRQWFL
jgi:hypothetical protein